MPDGALSYRRRIRVPGSMKVIASKQQFAVTAGHVRNIAFVAVTAVVAVLRSVARRHAQIDPIVLSSEGEALCERRQPRWQH